MILSTIKNESEKSGAEVQFQKIRVSLNITREVIHRRMMRYCKTLGYHTVRCAWYCVTLWCQKSGLWMTLWYQKSGLRTFVGAIWIGPKHWGLGLCVWNFRNHPPPNSTSDKLVGEYNLDDYVMPGDEKVRLHSSTYEQGKVLEWKKEPPWSTDSLTEVLSRKRYQ